MQSGEIYDEKTLAKITFKAKLSFMLDFNGEIATSPSR